MGSTDFVRHKTLWMLIVIGLLFALAHGLADPAEGANRTVGPGGAYSSIQTAINDASAGDAILVYNGTYNEDIVVNKSLAIIGNVL